MSKNAVVSDFMREAVREKATRELAALQQRADVLGGVERARDALQGVSTDLSSATAAIGSLSGDVGVTAKLKKLRKLVDDANALATEIGDALGVDKHRDTAAASREAILEALKSAGLDPNEVLTSPGGDAQ